MLLHILYACSDGAIAIAVTWLLISGSIKIENLILNWVILLIRNFKWSSFGTARRVIALEKLYQFLYNSECSKENSTIACED